MAGGGLFLDKSSRHAPVTQTVMPLPCKRKSAKGNDMVTTLSALGILAILIIIWWLLDVLGGGPRRRLVNRLMRKHGINYRE
jgi:hypothetical protein